MKTSRRATALPAHGRPRLPLRPPRRADRRHPLAHLRARASAPFVESIRTPAAISALNLSLLIVAIVVPLNVVFGVVTALALVRGRFPGAASSRPWSTCRSRCRPIVVGVSLIMLWGVAGWFGGLERSTGFKVIFGLPGMVLATIFVTLPFVVREVEPVLHEIGTEQEQAAATLGRVGVADLLADHPARRSGGASPTASCSPSPARSASSAR